MHVFTFKGACKMKLDSLAPPFCVTIIFKKNISTPNLHNFKKNFSGKKYSTKYIENH
jgi:hypothetical protein